MLEVQKLWLSVSKDGENPHFKSKYMTLDNVVDTLTPHLNRLGLLVIHRTTAGSVETIVVDPETSQTVSSLFPVSQNLDPQKVGSAITYAKRYNLGQLFNIITDRDDDANNACDKSPSANDVSRIKKSISNCETLEQIAVVYNDFNGFDWAKHSEERNELMLMFKKQKELITLPA